MTFEELAKQYENDTRFHSFAHCMKKSPAYQNLVDIGEEIVPSILQGLKDNTIGGVAWFLILEAITGEIPLKPEIENGWAKIKVEDTRQAWIKWGEKRN